MLIETLSTFPHMYDSVMGESMMKRAQEKGILEFRAHDLRDWTHDRHRTTDDDPYGGGAGLVMKCDPIFEAVEAILGKEFVEAKLAAAPPQGESQQRSSAAPQIVFLAPQGRPFDDAYADKLAAADRAVRAGTTELALVERPGHATTESYHETTVPESALVGTLVTVTL